MRLELIVVLLVPAASDGREVGVIPSITKSVSLSIWIEESRNDPNVHMLPNKNWL